MLKLLVFPVGRLSFLLLLASGVACTGSIAGIDGPGATGGSAGAHEPGMGGNDDFMPPDHLPPGVTPVDPASVMAQWKPLSRLTRFEFNNTVRDLLGDTTRPGDPLPVDGQGANGFATSLPATTLDATVLMELADGVASRAIARLDTLSPCDVKKGDRTCLTRFIDAFGLRAFRRPVDASTRADLLELYDKVTGTLAYTPSDGVRALIKAMVQMPQFLYHFGAGEEAPTLVAVDGQMLAPLDGYAMASRLSYFLWGSMPDQELFELAADGALTDPAVVRAQARRMLKNDHARDAVKDFYAQWFKLGQLDGILKDEKRYPEFTESMRGSMKESVTRFLEYITLQDGAVSRLMTANYDFVDANIATLYGMKGITRSDLQRVDLNDSRRSGLLTHPALLALEGSPSETHPIKRGVFVRKTLLCQAIPAPPPNIPVLAMNVDGTWRERLEVHRADKGCAACHAYFDELGLGLEHYDTLGRYQEKDRGRDLDTSGTLVDVSGGDKFFQDGVELAGILAAQPEFQSCVSGQLTRYGLGRTETEGELEVIRQTLGDDVDMREQMIALTTWKGFTHRLPGIGESVQ